MSLLAIVLISAVVLSLAYRVYGNFLSRLLELDAGRSTPAVELRDDVDYQPIEPKFLLSQHFSAIAAAGPIVGPILAGAAFGWLPALIWILVGSIFIGGVHDITALVASIRHRARSIAEVVRDHMSRRAYLLFLGFVWIALVYIIVAFTDVTAISFIGERRLPDGRVVTGGSVATSSLLYLILPIIMGLVLRFTRLSVDLATLMFLPLVGLAIWIGPQIPFDLDKALNIDAGDAQQYWNVALLAYCFVASVVPLWLLLQPRGHLGGYFLYFALAGGALGIILGGMNAEYPAFIGWQGIRWDRDTGDVLPGDSLLPILCITIACGACSGFHSIIASGTTSKQLRKETDAKPIGYGAMLLEAMVAVVALSCLMIQSPQASSLINVPGGPEPNTVYATGLGAFLAVVGIPLSFGVNFGFLAFTTFVYDTLDVCTRLGRFIIQELTGWKDRFGQMVATALTTGVPLYFLLVRPVDPKTNMPVQAWRVFWGLFGASNQLLAALTLLGITVWLWRTRRQAWVWYVIGLPTAWMYVMSTWALLLMAGPGISRALEGQLPSSPVPYVALVLVAMAFLLLVEAVIALVSAERQPPARPQWAT